MKMTNSSPDVMFEPKVHVPIRSSITLQRQPGLRSDANKHKLLYSRTWALVSTSLNLEASEQLEEN